MILTLMRHPAIDATGERCIGQTDVELSPDGRRALLSLAETACREEPDRILSSDLRRCRLLGEAIATRLELRLELDPIWREISFGRWENRTWSEIEAEEPQALSEWMTDYERVAPPGGESFQQLQARVISAISTRLATAPELVPIGRTLVVTHAGVIRAAISAFSNLSLRRAFEYAIPYGGQTSFHWNGIYWSMLDVTEVRRTLPRTP
jgi:alpha-ribazole phosphatase